MDESRLAPHDVASGKVTRRQFVQGTGAAGLLVAAGTRLAPSAAAAGRGVPVRIGSARYAPPPADTKGTLTTFNYGDAATQKIYSDAIGRFKQRYPNVDVKDNYVPVTLWSDYANKLTTQIAGGQSVDLIHVAIEGSRLIISKGLMDPLDDYIAADEDVKTLLDQQMAQPLKDAFTVDGKLYQIPVEWNNMVIFYNTKMFAAAGLQPPAVDWTWDDFLNAAKTLTTGSGGDKVYGYGVSFFTFGLVPWMLTNSTYPLTDDWSQSNLNDPKVLESVTFLKDLILTHQVSPTVEGTDNAQLFPAGKLAMTGFGRWPLPGFKDAGFTDFDIQYWPRKTAATSIHGIGGWGISPKSKNKDLSWELIKEFTGQQVNDDFARAGASIPALRSSAELPEFLSFPANAKIYYESLNDTKPVPSPANFNEFESILLRHLGEIFSGSTSPEDGLKAAHDEVSAAMAKLNG
jgi:multiple sugar transport system substrate-binding protein